MLQGVPLGPLERRRFYRKAVPKRRREGRRPHLYSVESLKSLTITKFYFTATTGIVTETQQ